MENRISYLKQRISDESITIFSIPWSYLATGIAFFLIGVLDFVYLGYHIGHPGEDGIGTHIGQGQAVFLGGLSFAWTVGLAPLIVGAIMIIYCIHASKQVIFSRTDNTYFIQERRLLFPFATELNRDSIKEIKHTNTGLKLRHIWILLFIPMGIRVLQFGIPLFGENLAHDEVLPTMMLITGIVDLLGTILTVLVPTHTLTFRTDTKKYSINYLPVSILGNKTLPHLFNLEKESPIRENKKFLNFRTFGGIGLIIFSIVGLSTEFLWGTDLSMVGITYGFYLVVQSIQQETEIFGYFTGYNNKKSERGKGELRRLSFIDVLAIGLLFYLSTLEFIWGWMYFVNINALLIIEMILTTVIWLGLLFWIFVEVTVPIKKFKYLKEYARSDKKLRIQIIFRVFGLVICIVLLLIKLI